MTGEEAPQKPILISIALIEHKGRYLVGQRGAGGPLAGCWEFPGGKCRPGESPAECAVRECLEETGLRAKVARLRRVVHHEYPHGPVELHFFDCTLDSIEDPIPRAPFRWVARAELAEYRFPEANTAVLQELTKQASRVS